MVTNSILFICRPDNLVTVSASIVLTKYRTRLRRKMNERDIVSLCTALQTKTDDDNKQLAKVTRGIHTDCLLNYETVKYFGGEQHEGERYKEAIREYQALEYKVTSSWSYCVHFLLLLKLLSVSLNILNLVQNFIIVSRFIYFIMHRKFKIALFC
jgi:ABC-type transport system involved in Fe-S cluster assembly fused permease/ATPase subunit